MSRDETLRRACVWVDLHLDEFFIERSTEQLLPSLKAIAELAHAGELLKRSPDEELSKLGARWIDHAWAATHDGDVIAKVIRSDPRLVLVATTLVPFHLAGKRNDSALLSASEQVIRAPLPGTQWALLARALPILGVEAPEDILESANRGSVLAQRLPVASLSIEAIYLLIHECLYRSAWTRDKLWCIAEEQLYLDQLLPLLSLRYVEVGDVDLVAELVLATHTLPFSCSDAATWKRLSAAQEPSGLLSPPPRAVTPLVRKNQDFTRAYHTTLVGIMAFAACRHSIPSA